MDINNSVILITGGSSGLGKDLARACVAEGASVIITGRDAKKLEEAAKDVGADAVHADVANDQDIEKTFEFIHKKYGRLDCLINNAGIGSWSLVEDLTREKLRDLYEINVFGAAMMGAHAARIMKEQQSGTIINICSTAALKGFAHGSIYASSKFALRGMTQCWQAELRPHNIRVIEVNPSEVPTAFAQENREERPQEAKKLSPKEITDTIMATLKMDDRGFIPEVTVWATNPF